MRENIVSLSIVELAKKIKAKELSPVEVFECFLSQIKRVNEEVNAFITIMSEDARDAAKKAEDEVMNGYYRGPLHGIPIGLKDVVFTKGVKTTMASPIYKDFIPNEDAIVVRKLTEAGAILIGKLNTHQFAYGPTGDRSYFGPVNNPFDVSRMSGGSSSGSAAAVATNMCKGAIGTDTSGSVRVPAAFCGIVGMKPTYGLVSRRGIYPLSTTLDHVGPMTRTVEDNALFLNAIAGYDPLDFHSKELSYYTNYYGCISDNIKDVVIGIPKNFYFEHVDIEIVDSVNKSIMLLERLGAKLEEIEVPNVEEMVKAQQMIIKSEAYTIHRQHLENLSNEWDEEVKERLYTGKDVLADQYIQARDKRIQAYYVFKQLFKKVNVIITPTTAMLAPKINQREINRGLFKGEHIRWPMLRLTSHINLIGFPALSLPCGISKDNLPIGVQFIGNTFQEKLLYRLGNALFQELSIIEKLDRTINVK
ncbi:amidase [Pueribacillus sp. YX66]|uniref:amidase n=1 Tax=Pueribacillus sp. YX66 TaxID=3229242 RepID=UPI00358D9BB6